MSKVPPMPSEVNILKTQAANKKGPGSVEVETTWPKPEFGASTTIDNITKEGKTITEFIVPAGSMFSLGAALPNHTVLKWGAYFPPGPWSVESTPHSLISDLTWCFTCLSLPVSRFPRKFPDGVLVPIHARMVSVQPLKTPPEVPPPSEAVCVIM